MNCKRTIPNSALSAGGRMSGSSWLQGGRVGLSWDMWRSDILFGFPGANPKRGEYFEPGGWCVIEPGRTAACEERQSWQCQRGRVQAKVPSRFFRPVCLEPQEAGEFVRLTRGPSNWLHFLTAGGCQSQKPRLFPLNKPRECH